MPPTQLRFLPGWAETSQERQCWGVAMPSKSSRASLALRTAGRLTRNGGTGGDSWLIVGTRTMTVTKSIMRSTQKQERGSTEVQTWQCKEKKNKIKRGRVQWRDDYGRRKNHMYQKLVGGMNFQKHDILFFGSVPDPKNFRNVVFSVLSMVQKNYILGARGKYVLTRCAIKLHKWPPGEWIKQQFPRLQDTKSVETIRKMWRSTDLDGEDILSMLSQKTPNARKPLGREELAA